MLRYNFIPRTCKRILYAFYTLYFSRFTPEKNKARSNAVPITVSLAGNSCNMPFVSVSAASVSHHHGPPIHSLQPQVNQQQVIHTTNLASAATSQQQFVDSSNVGVPMIPVVSAAPLAPEKLSPVTFQPNPILPSATVAVSTGTPVR